MASLFLPAVRRSVSNRTMRRVRGFAPQLPAPFMGIPTWSTAPTALPLPSGYVPPRPAEDGCIRPPISLARTVLGKNLPVYAQYRHGRSKVYTIIRGVQGDVPAFCDELAAVLGGAVVVHAPGSGTVRIDGHKVAEVRSWLLGLGL